MPDWVEECGWGSGGYQQLGGAKVFPLHEKIIFVRNYSVRLLLLLHVCKYYLHQNLIMPKDNLTDTFANLSTQVLSCSTFGQCRM